MGLTTSSHQDPFLNGMKTISIPLLFYCETFSVVIIPSSMVEWQGATSLMVIILSRASCAFPNFSLLIRFCGPFRAGMQLLLISSCLIGRPRPAGFLTAHKAGRLKLLPFATGAKDCNSQQEAKKGQTYTNCSACWSKMFNKAQTRSSIFKVPL